MASTGPSPRSALMSSCGSGQRTRLRSMFAIWWKGQNRIVAAPPAITTAAIKNAGTRLVAPATAPQITAPAAWPPNRTIW